VHTPVGKKKGKSTKTTTYVVRREIGKPGYLSKPGALQCAKCRRNGGTRNGENKHLWRLGNLYFSRGEKKIAGGKALRGVRTTAGRKPGVMNIQLKKYRGGPILKTFQKIHITDRKKPGESWTQP